MWVLHTAESMRLVKRHRLNDITWVAACHEDWGGRRDFWSKSSQHVARNCGRMREAGESCVVAGSSAIVVPLQAMSFRSSLARVHGAHRRNEQTTLDAQVWATDARWGQVFRSVDRCDRRRLPRFVKWHRSHRHRLVHHFTRVDTMDRCFVSS